MSKTDELFPSVSKSSVKKRRADEPSIIWNGLVVPLEQESRGRRLWRINSRSKHLPCIHPLKTPVLSVAKKEARKHLESLKTSLIPRARGSHSLEDVAQIYPTLSLGCNAETAKKNVMYLRVVGRQGFKKELASIPLHQFHAACAAYVTAVQDLDNPDRPDKGKPNYSNSYRRIKHGTVRSVLLQATSVFADFLHPQYREAGITLPADIANIQLPKARRVEKAPVNSDALTAAWEALRDTDAPLYRLIGVVHWSGLRKKEALACRPGWITPHESGYAFLVKDREDEGFTHKTGNIYRAPIRNAAFAAYLLTLPKDQPIAGVVGSKRYVKALEWLRQFTNTRRPMHRLRGNHADAVKRDAELIIRRAGDQAAANALGDTLRTTKRHYLSGE